MRGETSSVKRERDRDPSPSSHVTNRNLLCNWNYGCGDCNFIERETCGKLSRKISRVVSFCRGGPRWKRNQCQPPTPGLKRRVNNLRLKVPLRRVRGKYPGRVFETEGKQKFQTGHVQRSISLSFFFFFFFNIDFFFFFFSLW